MVDPQGREHGDGRIGAKQADDWQRPGALPDQPFHRQRQAEHQQQQRQQRGERHRNLLRARAAENRLQQQYQSRDRQIDQPRPMDVGAAMDRVDAMLDEIVPALPAEQGTHLGDPEVVVRIAKRERMDWAQAVQDDPGDVEQPGRDDDPAPVAEERARRFAQHHVQLALGHHAPPHIYAIVS